jgi:AmmeMemoRadiSam system protein A
MNNHSDFDAKEKLAKYAIEYYLKNGKVPDIDKKDLPEDFCHPAACFVSIYVDGNLRGCIGDYETCEPLYQNIIKNAINAATLDFRFPPVEISELPKLQIEVSVLTKPLEFRPKNPYRLRQFLGKEKPGLLIEKEGKRALFLPQVWKQIVDPSEFLSHLCLKAGLSSLSWQKPGMKFWTFTVKV